MTKKQLMQKLEKAMFNNGGIVGLAQGGRIGLRRGSRQPGMEHSVNRQARDQITRDVRNLQSQMEGTGGRAQDYVNVYADPSTHPGTTGRDIKPPRRTAKDYLDSYLTKSGDKLTAASFAFIPGQQAKSLAYAKDYLDYLDEQGVDTSAWNRIRTMEPKDYDVETYKEIKAIPGGPEFATNQVSPGHPSGDYNPNRDSFPMDYENFQLTKNQNPSLIMSGNLGNFHTMTNPAGAINPDTGLPFTNLEWDAFRDETVRDRGYETGREGPEWRQRGYPSEAAYLAALGGGGGGGGSTPTDTVGDYYGFKEWEDWTGGPTTPLFGNDTQYKALLNRGGRIGLYGGGMSAMNNPMNPMMNRGLGAMGSPGMNPYNQQNLTHQAQMRGQLQGRPPMPGGPNMAQGPGITGTQAAAKIAEKEQDTDLLKLIRMLASLGIPMEQLRGRTKEELVEMVISIKARTQPDGREEVVEEEQEEIMTAAHGGRVRAAGGLGEEFMSEAEASTGNPGNAEMFTEEIQAVRNEPMDPQEEYEEYRIQQIDLGEPVLSFDDWYNMEYKASEVGVAKGGRIGFSSRGYAHNIGGFSLTDILNARDAKNEVLAEHSQIGKLPYNITERILELNRGGKSYEDIAEITGVDIEHITGMLDLANNPNYIHPITDVKEMDTPAGLRDYGVWDDIYEERMQIRDRPEHLSYKAKGGLMRTKYAMGTEQPIIPSKDGAQIDYRGIGGYQPHGKKEKHDDVRALLAQGEFVVTSDAVKGIGDGDRDLGAKRMYDMMHKYEPIGRALS